MPKRGYPVTILLLMASGFGWSSARLAADSEASSPAPRLGTDTGLGSVRGAGEAAPHSRPALLLPPGSVVVSSAQAEPDEDGDGMSDAWERQFGLDPTVNDAEEDADYDGLSNLDEFKGGSHPRGYFRRYLAEGATGSFFGTTLDLFNPASDLDGTVLVRFFGTDGPLTSYDAHLESRHRHTIVVGDLPQMASAEFSTLVESDTEIVVERRMQWNDQGYGSHASAGVPEPSGTWYFAEGVTRSPFDAFLLLFNPQSQPVDVWLRHVFSDRAPLVTSLRLAPLSRRTVWLNVGEAGRSDAEFGTEVTTTCPLSECSSPGSGLPIVAEQAVYLSNQGRLFNAGAAAAGVTSLQPDWTFAEGAAGYFDMFLLLANFRDAPAEVEAQFRLANGERLLRSFRVDGHSRQTVWVNLSVPELGSSAATAVTLRSLNAVPIVAARSMWWPTASPDGWHEGHLEAGVPVTRTLNSVVAGIDATQGSDHYLLVDNLGPQGAALLTMQLDDGTVVRRTVAAPTTRTTFYLRDLFPELVGKRGSLLAESLFSGPHSLELDDVATAPNLVIEHAQYGDADSERWAAGSVTQATDVTGPVAFVSVFGIAPFIQLRVGQRLRFLVVSPWAYFLVPEPGEPVCPELTFPTTTRFLEPKTCRFIIQGAFLTGPEVHGTISVR